MQHFASGCEELAQKEYKRGHDNIAKKVHWDLCKKNGLEHTEKWYEDIPEGAVKNEEVKMLWDIHVQCDNMIKARRPDIIVIDIRIRFDKMADKNSKVNDEKRLIELIKRIFKGEFAQQEKNISNLISGNF